MLAELQSLFSSQRTELIEDAKRNFLKSSTKSNQFNLIEKRLKNIERSATDDI